MARNEDDFGWLRHLDKRGTPCAYCGEPSTETFIVEPDQYKGDAVARRGKRVGVCDEHYREPEPRVGPKPRRKRSAEQMRMDVDAA